MERGHRHSAVHVNCAALRELNGQAVCDLITSAGTPVHNHNATAGHGQGAIRMMVACRRKEN